MSLQSLRRSTIATFVLALLVSAPLSAQQAIFGGTVLRDGNEKPVANVEVTIESRNKSARSDSAGNFRIEGLAAGKHTVVVRQVGFEPLRTEIMLGATQTLEVDLLIKPLVTELAKVEVKAAATAGPWAIKLMDFEERRKIGTGRYLTAEFFEQQDGRPLSAFLLSKIPGVKFMQVGGRKWMASTRGCGMKCDAGSPSDITEKGIPSACYMQVVVNGIVRYNGSIGQPMFDVDELNSKDIIGLEFYTVATTPLQYNQTAAKSPCGTVIIWTKGG